MHPADRRRWVAVPPDSGPATAHHGGDASAVDDARSATAAGLAGIGASSAEIAGEAAAAAAVANINPQIEVRDTTDAVVPLDLTAAAFFDVDNTMMMGASIFHF